MIRCRVMLRAGRTGASGPRGAPGEQGSTGTTGNVVLSCRKSESESECKCLTCNQKPTGSQFSLLHEPN